MSSIGLELALQKEHAERQRMLAMGAHIPQATPEPEAPKLSSKAPPAHLWPMPLKMWVQRSFDGCRSANERTAMQNQVAVSIMSPLMVRSMPGR